MQINKKPVFFVLFAICFSVFVPKLFEIQEPMIKLTVYLFSAFLLLYSVYLYEIKKRP